MRLASLLLFLLASTAWADESCVSFAARVDGLINQRESDGEDFYVKVTILGGECGRVQFSSFRSPMGRYVLPQDSVAVLEYALPGETEWQEAKALFATHSAPPPSDVLIVEERAKKVAYVPFQTSHLIHDPCGTRFRLKLRGRNGEAVYSSEFILHDSKVLPEVEYTGDMSDAK